MRPAEDTLQCNLESYKEEIWKDIFACNHTDKNHYEERIIMFYNMSLTSQPVNEIIAGCY